MGRAGDRCDDGPMAIQPRVLAEALAGVERAVPGARVDDWDDPLSDLAQTRVHVRFHAPADDDALLAG